MKKSYACSITTFKSFFKHKTKLSGDRHATPSIGQSVNYFARWNPRTRTFSLLPALPIKSALRGAPFPTKKGLYYITQNSGYQLAVARIEHSRRENAKAFTFPAKKVSPSRLRRKHKCDLLRHILFEAWCKTRHSFI